MDQSHAPGFKRRPNKTGIDACYWVADRACSAARDYPLKTIRLHGTDDEMAQRCRVLTSELREWLSRQGLGDQPVYEGTLKGLIVLYRTTAESSYHTIKHSTRVMYDESLDLLAASVGTRRLDKLTGIDFTRWYNNLKEPAKESAPERVRRAYKAMQLLRIIMKFGVAANVTECFRLSQVLEVMRFTSPPKRKDMLTYEQMKAICEYAINDGRVKVAIGQAMQFELTLRQIDVIGEWLPANEGEGGILYHGQLWSGGALWSHIDDDWIFRKETTKTGQIAMHDIKAYPFLLALLKMVPISERIGPIVLDRDGMPFNRRQWAKLWRRYAKAVGVPAEVLNRDSRAGGITEGSDAGADIEHLRHQANHADIRTTGGYNRNTLAKTRTVAQLRVAHRND